MRLSLGPSTQDLLTSSPEPDENPTLFSGQVLSDRAVIGVDPDRQQIVSFSPAAAKLFGFDPQSVIGQSLDLVLPTGLRALKRAATGAAIRSVGRTREGRFLGIEVRLISPTSASPVLLIITQGAARAPTDHTSGDQCVWPDPPCREREAALLAREQLDAFFAAALEGVVTTDERGTIESVNPTAEQVFGYHAAELRGRSIIDLVPEPHRAEHARYLAELEARGDGHSVITPPRRVVGQRKDGSRCTLEVGVTRLTLGGRTRLVVMVHDRSKCQQLELALSHAQKMEALGCLVSSIAHDFSNILTGIMACTKLAQRSIDRSHPASEMLTELKTAADSGAALTKQLLSFSRKHGPEGTRGSLDNTIERLDDLLRRLVGGGIVVELDLGQTELVSCAEPLLEQILINLAVNARDAMPGGGTLKIATRMGSGRSVQLVVRDDGRGMTADERAQACQPFFTTKPEGQGTGLGLFTVKSIVDGCGGTMTIASAQEQGTTITIDLPAPWLTSRAPGP